MKATVHHGLTLALERWRLRTIRFNEDAQIHNKKVEKYFRSGTISADEAKDRHRDLQPIPPLKVSSYHALKFRERFKWVERKLTAPAGMLPYDHPKTCSGDTRGVCNCPACRSRRSSS